jgi:hypothetical protein
MARSNWSEANFDPRERRLRKISCQNAADQTNKKHVKSDCVGGPPIWVLALVVFRRRIERADARSCDGGVREELATE